MILLPRPGGSGGSALTGFLGYVLKPSWWIGLSAGKSGFGPPVDGKKVGSALAAAGLAADPAPVAGAVVAPGAACGTAGVHAASNGRATLTAAPAATVRMNPRRL